MGEEAGKEAQRSTAGQEPASSEGPTAAESERISSSKAEAPL